MMKRNLGFFFLAFFAVIVLDQIIKIYLLRVGILNQSLFQTHFIDIVLVLNKGVAFSFLSFLGDSLKWIILALLCAVFVLIILSREFFSQYHFLLGFILGAGASNLIDRFAHGGVVDYIFWHFGFNFAIFNVADAIINISIAYIVIRHIYCYVRHKKNL